MSKFDKSLNAAFSVFDKTYVQPLFSLEANLVRKYLDDVALASLPDYMEIAMKVISAVPLPKFGELMPDIKTVVLEIIDSGRKLYSEASVRKMRDAISLELDNEIAMLRDYHVAFIPELQASLESQGISPLPQAINQQKLVLTMDGYLSALLSGNKKAVPVVDELTNLCLEYAEETDAFVTTIDLLLNEKKKSALLNAYSNFERSVEKAA